MSSGLSYRIASAIYLLFAAGHTFGFLSFRPGNATALAVWQGMQNVRFEAGGSSFTYGGFYLGFGLSITYFMVFSAFLCWWMGDAVQREPRAVSTLGWALVVQQVAGLVLSALYFALPPTILSGLLALLLGWAAFRAGGMGKRKGEPEGSPLMNAARSGTRT